jgi:hypothetical protein
MSAPPLSQQTRNEVLLQFAERLVVAVMPP